MKWKNKLSLLMAVMMVLSFLTPDWGIRQETVNAASGGPLIINQVPANGATSVSTLRNTPLKLVFDEPVEKSSGSFSVTIHKDSNNEIVETIALSGINLSPDRKEAIIYRNVDLALNTAYYVKVDAGAFRNVSNGALFAGISQPSQWNFTTAVSEDRVKPNIISVSPQHQQGNVPLTASLLLTFDKVVNGNSGDIIIESNNDARRIPITSTEVSGSGSNLISIQPKEPFKPNTQYTITLPEGLYRDNNGNLSNRYPNSWTFTTEGSPVSLATVDPLFPKNNAMLVPSNAQLTMSFDKNVAAQPNKYIEIIPVGSTNRIKIQATDSRVTISGREVTIKPGSSLMANMQYYVIVEAGAFSEAGASSNIFPGIISSNQWTFTTVSNDTTPPRLTKFEPAGSGAGPNSPLLLTFDEPVFPGENNATIDITQTVGNKLHRSIKASSTRITGWGTTTLKIDVTGSASGESSAPYLSNTQYSVKVNNKAIRDAAGNAYGGTSWNFTVTTNKEGPYLIGMTPEDGANPVAVDETFSAVFNKPVQVYGNNGIVFYPKASSGNPVYANYKVDPNNNKAVTFEPRTSLERNRSYYVYIAEDAIADMTDNNFIGIAETNRWTFTTVGGDTTPPAISSSEAGGSIVRLIYNKPLNSKIQTSAAYYSVKVAGVDRQVTKVETAGNTVTLTVSGSINSSQQVKVSYTKPSSNYVQDLSGNAAPGFDSLEVKNGASSTAPSLTGGHASGNTVVLNFNQQLSAPTSSYAYTQFSVNVNGTSYLPSSLTVSGSSIILSINVSVTNNSNVRVSYTPGSYPITGTNGIKLNAINSYSISHSSTGGGSDNSSQLPPMMQYITAAGTTVVIKYNKTLNPYSNPLISQYSVTAGGVTKTIKSAAISGDSVILTLTSSIAANQTVLVSYIGSSGSVSDLYGYFAPTFNNVQANQGNNGGTGLPASMRSAIIKGSVITLTFSETLQPNSIPQSSMFLVRVNDNVRLVNNVTVSGSTVTLTLTAPAGVGERVTANYTSSDYGLKTWGGTAISSFSNVNVVNQTTLIDTLTGDYEVIETNTVLLKMTTATVSSANSPAGVRANKYKIKNESFITAVTTSHNAGIGNPRIAFRVPASEQAAIVAIPVIALEMSQKQSGNVTWVIQHGDASYELPLKELNFAELSRFNNGSGIANEIVITIDQGSSSLTSSLTKAVSSAKATPITEPAYFEAAVEGNNSRKVLTDFSDYVTKKLSTTASVNYGQSAAVQLDPVTGLITYVPTVFSKDGNTTTASFKNKGGGAYVLVRSSATYSDLAKHWSKDYADDMIRKFIVEGRSSTKFEPEKEITRGEFAAYIAKGLGLAGDPAGAAKFKDVNGDTVMGAYIGAAAKAGIISGTSSTTFKPNNPVKREEMAAMMMRAAKVAGVSVKLPQSADLYLQVYKDRNKISSYAKNDMASAIYLGVIHGKTSTTLSPHTNAKRSEGVVMIARLLQKAEFMTR